MSDFIEGHGWGLGQRTVSPGTPDEFYALPGQDRLLCIQKTLEKLHGIKPLLLGTFPHQICTSKDPLVWEYLIIKSSQGALMQFENSSWIFWKSTSLYRKTPIRIQLSREGRVGSAISGTFVWTPKCIVLIVFFLIKQHIRKIAYLFAPLFPSKLRNEGLGRIHYFLLNKEDIVTGTLL